MNYLNAMTETLTIQTEVSLAKEFMSGSGKLGRFAIGKNSESLLLNRLVPLSGIIDDKAAPGGDYFGIPLLKSDRVPFDALIANCSTAISPVAVLQHLDSCGFKNVVGYHELVMAAKGRLAWPQFVQKFRAEIETYGDVWQRMFDSMSDQESKKTLLNVGRFRHTANPKYMQDYQVRLDQQYFEDFMGYRNEIFVDAGGFDGDTTEIFATRYSDYKKILFFEPSEKNMLAARRRLSGIERINFYCIGLSDQKGTLRFNQDQGSASSITESSADTIEVDTLDSLVEEPVTFIKMDLEGWEFKALQGASGHIKRNRPKLAIAVYHDASDFRIIFEWIESLKLDYKIYLRHYTQGWSETIMFFHPQHTS
jgi:FkbM family methyltransferase